MTENMQEMECYIGNAIRTDLSPEQYQKAAERIAAIIRLEHAGHGIVTEGAELMDAFKRHIYYGKPLDEINVKEEAGDLMWYVAILMDELDLQFGIKASEILEANIAKLRQRYPEKFDETKALNRDTDSERKILENGTA